MTADRPANGSAERVTPPEAARAALAAREGGPAAALVTLVAAPAAAAAGAGLRLVVREDGAARGTLGDAALDAAAVELARRVLAGGGAQTHVIDVAGRSYTLYVEAHHPPDELLIVGAGHIAVPLARLGALTGFRVTVLDDRDDFATTDRFPEAAAVVRADFSDPFRDVAIGPRTHVVLVTRAHKYDFDCLLRLLDQDIRPRYLGLIGSRRRIRAAFHALLEAGVPRERLRRVHAPVGLDIGAETPEEIAVSIAAELIRLRRRGETAASAPDPDAAEPGPRPAAERAALSLGEQERVLDRFFPEEER